MNGNKLISILLIVTLVLCNCAGTKVLSNGIEYKSYGILNKNDKKPEVIYKKKQSSLWLGILLFETVFCPVYYLGFKLYEPEKLKSDTTDTIKE